MDNQTTVLVVLGMAFVLILGGAVLGMVALMLHCSKASMDTLANLFRHHTVSVENLKAIETCGVEGMRGVVARSQVRPSVLDLDESEEPIPSPDEAAGRINTRYMDVSHMAAVGPEDYQARTGPYPPETDKEP